MLQHTQIFPLDNTYANTYDWPMSTTSTLTASQARADLYNIVKSAGSGEQEYVIQPKNGPAAVLISLDEYESWKETAEILMIPGALESILEGVEQARLGQGVPLSEIM